MPFLATVPLMGVKTLFDSVESEEKMVAWESLFEEDCFWSG